ncbi:MAG TPA: DUF4097 family beta strand repeat-containing protein [Steroidobacteraceae bacterium]
MSTRMRSATRAAALLLMATATPAHAWWDDAGCKYSADRQVSIDTTGVERVEIMARAGDLDVRPASGTVLAGRGKACVSREEYLAKTQLRVQRDGNVVRLWVEAPETFSGIGLFYAALDLTVTVPAALPVSITDTSGDVKVDGLRVTRITDSSGDLLATNLRSDVQISDSSGDVRVEQAAGRVELNDSSGDIIVRGAREVVITGDSSGDIVIERVAGDVKIDNDSSGDITVRDVGRNVTLLADSSGDVHVSGVKGAVQLPK